MSPRRFLAKTVLPGPIKVILVMLFPFGFLVSLFYYLYFGVTLSSNRFVPLLCGEQLEGSFHYIRWMHQPQTVVMLHRANTFVAKLARDIVKESAMGYLPGSMLRIRQRI